MTEIFIAITSHSNDTEPVLDAGYYGFWTKEEAQEFLRVFREEHGIAGHDNTEPTAEENEAWSAEGWTFAVKAATMPNDDN